MRVSLLLAFLTTLASSAAGQSLPAAVPRDAVRPSGASASAHVDGALRQLISDSQNRPAADQRASVTSRVPVTIRFRSSDSPLVHRRVLSSFGVTPANEYGTVVETYVSVDSIESIAANPEVAAIDWIVPPAAAVIDQAVTVHNASSWQAAGLQGDGVKVGIIDVGFIGLTSLIGSELPGTVVGRCYTGIGTFNSSLPSCESGSVHGTAVAEAVADMAPGGQLYVANPQSPLDLRTTVAWMTSQGVRIINHSVVWTWSGPGDGTTPFSDSPLKAVDDAVVGGALWTNAAGNFALSTWSGAYGDANGNNWLEFSGGGEFNGVNLGAGQQLIAQARWDDSWTSAARDLDLYLLDSFGNIVAWSEGVQDGAFGATPREVIVFTAPSSGTYFLAVHRYAGSAPAWVDVQAFSQQSLQFSTAAHSIANPAETANPGALAVGAVPWSNTSSLEPFSSRGPTRDDRMKPDLVAADRGDSATYGPGGFAGTSQASPHVAGLAALVLEAFPGVEPRVLANYLRKIAQPRGAPDNTFGAGFAQVPVFPATISLSAVVTATSSFTVGQPVALTAFAIGGQAPFEYKFWMFTASKGWTVLQDYGPSNVANWTPSAPGTYSLQVWARRFGSSAAYDDWRGLGPLEVAGPPPVSVTSFVANMILPAPVNTTLAWTAVANGGVAPLQYKFLRFREGTGWSVVQDYSGSNTFIWTTRPGDEGRYALQVWVRSAGSTAAYDAWAGTSAFDIFVPPVVVTSLTSNVSFPALVGTPITWTATALGGATSLQYEFWRFKQGGGWTNVQPYSSANTFSWTPTANDAGTYAIQVLVRQVGSVTTYDAWRGTDFFVLNPRPPAALTSFIQTPASPTITGTPITWWATANGGTPPLQYKFWLSSNGVWTLLQDYSLASSATWTPLSAGTYAVQVWVRGTGSTAAYEDWRDSGSFTIAVSPNVFISGLSASVSLPTTVTRPMTWTATAGGGSGPLNYRFFRYRQSVGWSMVQDYSPNASYTWTPAVGEDGTYAIQVWVRAADSTALYDQWRDSGSFRVLPPTVLFMLSKAGDWIGGGTTRLFTPTEGLFTASRYAVNTVRIQENDPAYAQWWYLFFAAPNGVELTPGVYANATRWPFQASTAAGLDVSGDGRGCNESFSRFVVREVTYLADGTPSTFAADFEQHCEGWAPALYGSIRVNSMIPIVSVQPLVFSSGSPIPVGVPVTWSAGTTPGREYRAWLYQQSTRTWKSVHDYSADPTVAWTPQPGDQGDWVVVMWERPVGSTIEYDTWRVSEAVKVQ